MTMTKPAGYILYRGPSVLDGAPIVAIATMSTTNDKTGDMVQTWILRDDISPLDATKAGQDASVCGDCPHRHYLGGACYVTVFQAPLGIWKAYKRGKYSTNTEEFMSRIANRRVRFGAYGDPAAVPVTVWAPIANGCIGYTGYTHQVNHIKFDSRILNYAMQSVDTAEQAIQAKGRYFRVKLANDPVLPREVECLSDSIGKSCADCLLCDGGTKGKSVYITVHGAKAKRYDPQLIAVA
jgi:hypothetical protein